MKMSKCILQVFALLLSMLSVHVRAHDVPASNVWFDIGTYAVQAEIALPLGELREAIGLPVDATAAALATQLTAQVEAYVEKHVDITAPDGRLYTKKIMLLEANHINGSDWVVVHINFQAPADMSTSRFVLRDDIIVADIITHNILIFVRRDFRNAVFSNQSVNDGEVDAQPQMIGVMHYQQKQLTVDGSGGSWMQGFKKVFQLGMQHIAEGADHVMFLLVLLLSAPLCVNNRRWSGIAGVKASAWKVLKIVSGFTLGHSFTLILGAVGIIKFPSAIIEVLIALSIFISAVHAIRPLFANREHYIAVIFGLVHGMAFAKSITGFNYDSVALVFAVLGFNLGIETMQLVIVAAVLPSLLLMRATVFYRYFRIAIAITTGMLAIAWMLERAFAIANPLTFVSDMLMTHGVLALGILAAFATVFYVIDVMEVFALARRSQINR